MQAICAYRLCFPDVGIALSTREPAPLRDALIPLGVTTISAGSHTEPGSYTGQGREDLHLAVNGRRWNCPQLKKNHASPTPLPSLKSPTPACRWKWRR